MVVRGFRGFEGEVMVRSSNFLSWKLASGSHRHLSIHSFNSTQATNYHRSAFIPPSISLIFCSQKKKKTSDTGHHEFGRPLENPGSMVLLSSVLQTVCTVDIYHQSFLRMVTVERIDHSPRLSLSMTLPPSSSHPHKARSPLHLSTSPAPSHTVPMLISKQQA